MAWEKKYNDARNERFENDPEYRAKRNAQAKPNDAEARKAYMREYVKRNAARVKELRDASKDHRNNQRRAVYASDETVREKARKQANEWQKNNPDKRLDQSLKKYGITKADFDRMLAEQGGGCAICKRTKSVEGWRMHVDHCHETGVVRGILCSSCNLGIGKFSDDPDRLEAAAAYLRKFKK